MTYGDGKFVAISYGWAGTAISEDGINWTVDTNLPSSSLWTSINYCNGEFIVTAQTLSNIARSSDGVKWTTNNLGSSSLWNDSAYGNGMYVIFTTSSSQMAYSEDGVSWTVANNLPTAQYWQGSTFGDKKFVAVSGGSQNSNVAAYSEDGVKWTRFIMPKSTKWQDVTYGG